MIQSKKRHLLAVLAALLCACLLGSVAFGLRRPGALATIETPAVSAAVTTGKQIEAFDTLDGSSFSAGSDTATIKTAENLHKEGAGALFYTGQGITQSYENLPVILDLSAYDTITFWLYVSDVTPFRGMADGQIEFRKNQGVGDANELTLSLKDVGPVLKNGWNFVSVPMKDIAKSGAASWSEVGFVEFYFVGLPAPAIEVGFDDLRANSVAGKQAESFDDKGTDTEWGTGGGRIETGEAMHKEGTGALFHTGGGVQRPQKALGQAADLSGYDTLTFWLYVNSASQFATMADGQLELRPSASSTDSDELTVNLKTQVAPLLKDGWNFVSLPMKDIAKAGSASWSNIGWVGFYYVGVTHNADGYGLLEVGWDDLRGAESWTLKTVEPMAEPELVLDCDKLSTSVFPGATLESDDHKQGVAAYSFSVAEAQVYSASFAPLETGLNLSGAENVLGLTFWLYVDDPANLSSLHAQIASSKTVDAAAVDWTLTDLSAGWNWVVLSAAEGTSVGSVVDTLNIQSIVLKATPAEGKTAKVMVDRFSVVNCSTEGYDAQPSADEKRTYTPVDRTVVSNFESEEADFRLPVSETEHMEGYGAGQWQISGKESATVAVYNKPLGKLELFFANPTESNEFGATMWLYVEDASALAKFEVLFGTGTKHEEVAAGSTIRLAADISKLKDGWNWLVLAVAEVKGGATLDVDALNAVEITAVAKAGSEEGTFAALNLCLDRLSVANIAKEANTTQPPATEKFVRNPISAKIIIDCNSVSEDLFGTGNKIDVGDYRYQSGSVMTSGAGVQLAAKRFSVGKTDLTKKNLVLCMWVKVKNIKSAFTAGDAQVELSSSANFDQNELTWELKDVFKGKEDTLLENEWMWLVLKGTDAKFTGGEVDFDNISRFRIYTVSGVQTELHIDRITIANADVPASYATPDWESEVSTSGDFTGKNGTAANNQGYFETEIVGEDFSYERTYEITEGCGSAASGTLGLGAAALCALLAGGILAAKKRGR